MRFRHAFAIALVASALGAASIQAQEIKNVPVVTQIQGVTFYRSSVTISNGNPTITTPVEMLFSYRSPADGSFQATTLTLNPPLGLTRSASSTTSFRSSRTQAGSAQRTPAWDSSEHSS